MGVKNVCLIGFSHDAEEKIKELFEKYVEEGAVEFVYANEKKILDGAVINASLLDAPQIQKYIQTVKYPIVCICPNPEAERKAARYRLHAIRSTEVGYVAVRQWLAVLLGEDLVTRRLEPEPRENPILTRHRARASTVNAELVLRAIKQNQNKIFRGQNGESLTWVRPAQNVVFINYARDNVPGFDAWEWIEVEEEDIPFYARKLKLDLWLFETLWHSNMNGGLYINSNARFRLLHWPQPLSRNGRTEALKLAACAQTDTIGIQGFQQKTNYPLDQIERFLFATTTAGQIEELYEGTQVSMTVQQQMRQQHRLNDGQKKEKLSLLQRLRAKLGL